MAVASAVSGYVSSLSLKTAVERAAEKVPQKDWGKVYYHLWVIQGSPSGEDYHYGEHAFHGKYGKSATDQEKLDAIDRYLKKEFEDVPQKNQHLVYHYLWEVHGKKDQLGYGENAFHNREGSGAELFEKVEAVIKYYSQEGAIFKRPKALPAPDWALDGVIYSVFVRNFSATGDLNSVTTGLESLKKLGVSVLWLLPLHPIGIKHRKGTLGSPYSVQDYYHIDPEIGTVKDLQVLVEKAHKLGMKVILDAVLNHTSWDNELLIKEPGFFKRNKKGEVISPNPDWSDVAALDYDNPKVHDYVINMLRYWVETCDVDGFRFDAAFAIQQRSFWEKTSKALIAQKKDVLLLGEIDSPEAFTSGINMDYAWKFEHALNTVIDDGEHATETLKVALEKERADFPRGAAHLRFSDNHDKKRAITIHGEKAVLAASALVFALPGVPLLYNGMEVGDATESCAAALFEKMPIFWKSEEMRPHFPRFYSGVIALRNAHSALRSGELHWVANTDESSVVSFLRKGEKEEFLVVINFSNKLFDGGVDLDITKYKEVTPEVRHLKPGEEFTVGAWGFRYFQRS